MLDDACSQLRYATGTAMSSTNASSPHGAWMTREYEGAVGPSWLDWTCVVGRVVESHEPRGPTQCGGHSGVDGSSARRQTKSRLSW